MPVYLALGANQKTKIDGNLLTPAQTFCRALKSLDDAGILIQKTSSIWQGPAWPDPAAQPPYKNAVIEVETTFNATALLEQLKRIEKSFGRQNSERNAPRPLDLDILDYRGQVLEANDLILPHPRMCVRAFVLFPLYEIAPDWKDPIKNRTIQDWIARLPFSDVDPIKRISQLTF